MSWRQCALTHLLSVHPPAAGPSARGSPGDRSAGRGGLPGFPNLPLPGPVSKRGHSRPVSPHRIGSHGQNSSIAMTSFGLWLGAWLVVGLGLLSALPCCVRAAGPCWAGDAGDACQTQLPQDWIHA